MRANREDILRTIVFDFGGVLAEEGFREGLKEIARKNGLDPDAFFLTADEIIYETGYLTGKADETGYWNAVRLRTGIRGSDEELREEILKRFILRPDMIGCLDLLRSKGFTVVMLSDQTNWLDEINEKDFLFRHFDRVLNSFRIGMSKREVSTFQIVCDMLRIKPSETIFVDDNKNHIQRAALVGMNTIHFIDFGDYNEQMRRLAGTSC